MVYVAIETRLIFVSFSVYGFDFLQFIVAQTAPEPEAELGRGGHLNRARNDLVNCPETCGNEIPELAFVPAVARRGVAANFKEIDDVLEGGFLWHEIKPRRPVPWSASVDRGHPVFRGVRERIREINFAAHFPMGVLGKGLQVHEFAGTGITLGQNRTQQTPYFAAETPNA